MKHYPHHIGDFDKATRHLTRIERSIYRDLIELYYDTEQQLTLDMPALCRRIIARTNEESTAVEQVLNEFFNETPTGWFHSRCNTEIEKYQANASSQAKAGKASAAARAAKAQQAIKGTSTAAEQILNEESTAVEQVLNVTSTNRKPLTVNHEPVKTNPIAHPSDDADEIGKVYTPAFTAFWEMYPNKKSKGDAAKVFGKIVKAEYPAIRKGLESAKQSAEWLKDGGQFIPHPGKWLRARGWEDEHQSSDSSNDGMPRNADGSPNLQEWMRSQQA